MKSTNRFAVLFLCALALGAGQFRASPAQAQSTYFTSRGCVNCHAAPTVATCNGCHHHGNSSLKAVTNKTSYAPGETVTATLSGGSKTGWIRAVLYDQSNVQLAISNGNASGMGSSTTFPAALTASAPTTPGTYTWKMAYFGNLDGSGAGDVHGEKTVTLAAFTVASATVPDTTAPVVAAFTLPATAANLTVAVSSFTATDNVAVTGYLINKSATPPAASAAGWTATAPAGVTAVAGSNTFYAWAKDAAGNVSVVKSATVVVTVTTADTTPPTLTLSMLADGASTNNVTLNVSGTASDAGGLQSVTVNGQAVTANADGSFSTALNLVAGANVITVVAADKAGNQTTATRTVTYDAAAPVLTVANPADNSTTTQSFITVSGTVSENSTVTVRDNNGSPQTATMNGNSFSATVTLVSGVNTIDIAATDLAGNTATAKRTVTYDTASATIALAVTSPDRDITTNKQNLVLKGTVTDALGRVKVTITMNGRTYRPMVSRTGSFQQRLVFSQSFAERMAARRNPNASTSRQYAITITATDAAGNSGTVTRNVIYNPKYSGGNDD